MLQYVQSSRSNRRAFAAGVITIAMLWTSVASAEGLLGGLVSVSAGDGGVSVSVGGGSDGGSSGGGVSASVGGGGASASVGGGSGGGSINVGVGNDAGSGNLVTVPGLASVNITGGGNPGLPGPPVGGGQTTHYNSQTNIYTSGPGGSGGSAIPQANLSGKLRALLNIMQSRTWLAYMKGRSICLPQFGVTEVAGWMSHGDMQKLQQMLVPFAQDIANLRTMLNNCRAQRQGMGSAMLNRAIAVDVRNGMPVLWLM